MRVEDMVCGHCESTIQGAVRKLPGIKKVKASKRKKEVVVDYDALAVTQQQIIAAIASTGYRVIQN